MMEEDAQQDSEIENVVFTIGGTEFSDGLNWQLWVPAIIGIIASVISKMTFEDLVSPLLGLSSEWWLGNGTLLFSGDIFTFFLFIISLKLYDKWRDRTKFILSVGLSVTICLLGVVFLTLICWVFIILAWILITVVWGQYRLSPPRTGIWLGVGGAVSIVLGNLVTHFTM